ncbi:hypothetical protein MSM1_20615 [Mycobacterium sp. SM1]|uniref:hypothetical protein n=1 Tax=Mycobacterium sp. SM1 TaxID=2816243 RepID=UPI001BCB6083|nr:hypothetical protein [Mycobacterium sp. SM1]MBS4730616.1 hypothetical protein [Mycobacterium sp. SM1]
MTSTRQHIEDLDAATWAALTKRAAADAVSAAQRLGRTPPPELTAVAAMTERDLVEHRARFGPARKRQSAVMRLVEADHLRVVAESLAREAQQGKQDAEAAAALARAQAQQSARVAEQAREQARAAEAQGARRDAERAAELAATQEALDKLRAELDQVRADTAAAVEAARERVSAADKRAEQRMAERVAERAAAQRALEEVRAELARVRADAANEISAAVERVSAAEARARQRAEERAAERAAAQKALEELRAEIELVRADADAEVAAAREQAKGQTAAAQQAIAQMRAELDRVRAEAAGEVTGARELARRETEAAQHAVAQMQAEIARLRTEAATEVAAAREQARSADGDRLSAQSASPQLLSIPIPPVGLRAHTGHIEDALSAVRELDYVLEASLADDAAAPGLIDVELVGGLVATVQEQAGDLSQELRGLPSRYSARWQMQAASDYAGAAATAYGAVLQRIADATEQLSYRDDSAIAAVVEMVTAMLDEHPWRQR